jgi:hypothetical protein
MELTIENGEQVQVNEDVTFYAHGTTFDAVRSLADLQRMKRQLKSDYEPVVVYHLLHVTDIITPWFEEIQTDLSELGAQDLAWQIQQAQGALETKRKWESYCA